MTQFGELDERLGTFTTTIESFFTDLAPRLQDNDLFPMWNTVEGGCQFAFDRIPDATVKCHSCHQTREACSCSHRMMCEMDAAPSHVIMLDLDRIVLPGEGANKYDPPSPEYIDALRTYESRLSATKGVAFYYRTKCYGLRVGLAFEARVPSHYVREAVGHCIEQVKPPADVLKPCHAGCYSPIFQVYPRRGTIVWLAQDLLPLDIGGAIAN